MNGLLIKDIRWMLVQKKFFLLLVFIAVICGYDSGGMFSVGYLGLISVIFLISTITQDEYNNGLSFLMTLPAGRKTYVREKYVFGFVLLGLLLGIGFCIVLGYRIFRGEPLPGMDDLLGFLLYILTIICFESVTLPFVFYFGSEKGRIAMACAFGILCAAGFWITQGTGMSIEEVLVSIIGKLPASGLAELGAYSLVGGCVLLMISCIISTMIMERKEF